MRFLFKNVPGQRLVYIYMVITMFFSGGLLPDYLLAKNLGLINTRWVVILWGGYPLFSSFAIILKNLPLELRKQPIWTELAK